MKANENFLKESDKLKAYLAQINRDSRFLRGQLVFGSILLLLIIFLISVVSGLY